VADDADEVTASVLGLQSPRDVLDDVEDTVAQVSLPLLDVFGYPLVTCKRFAI